ncbi:N-acetyl sugar amidotransferase [uncultured Clostridium sp.]|jgi:N-acetyl sugar amidotransferase|uniref:N-acetyl sugar amidotransferase n=1 Tax=uncultured Clostridium sp. TaxID=59620 RepID=UPI0025CF02E4|nr:N-acetyl sugar amidotransferase [uncultured Clostridium sp.]
MIKREYQVCSNCVMDTTDSRIKFDEKGVCDHCNNYYSNIKPNWHPDERGAKELASIVEKIKAYGKGKKYDCIIGLSGGVDSSYLLYYAVEKLGLRPLVFAVDTGWNLDVAVENIKKMINGLNLELYTEVINWNEMKDLQVAYFKSQVPYQDIPQDHVIFAALYNYAAKNGIKYVLTGGNYSTECVREPNEWVYVNDVKQIKDIHKKFGKIKLKTLPLCGMFKYRLYYRYFKGMKVVKPLDLIPYEKEMAISTLEKRFGWQRYANKHFECIFTRFYEGYWLIKKFGYDKRRAHFSSLILTGQLKRDEALEILAKPPYDEETAMQDLEYITNKLGLSKEEFFDLMNKENKTFRDYKSSYWLINLAIRFATALGCENRQFR